MYISHKYKILFLTVPKVGSTTLKKLMWFAETGHQMPDMVHNLVGTKSFNQNEKYVFNQGVKEYKKYCIIRDPIDRFISNYNHRILVKEDHLNNMDVFKKYKLQRKPSFGHFLDKIHNYNQNGDIRHHTHALCHYLGVNVDLYDEIFTMKDINTKIFPMMEEICGFKMVFDMTATNAPKVMKREDLHPKQEEKIREIYKRDYCIYGNYL